MILLIILTLALFVASGYLARKAYALTPLTLKAESTPEQIKAHQRAEVLSGRYEAAHWVAVIAAGTLLYFALTHHA